MAETYLSKRNKEKLTVGGYAFRFDKRSSNDPELLFWRCDQKLCKARIHTRNGEVVHEIGDHQHAPNLPKVEADKALNRMKSQAHTTRDATRQILADVHDGLSQATVLSLPSKFSMTRSIQRQRQRNNLPRLPATLAELGQIPEDMKVLTDGTTFLAYDSGRGADRILLFATPDGLRLLFEQKDWFADGTFKVAPGYFTQVYSIHVLYMGSTIPVVFALLPSKSRATCDRLLQALVTLRPGIAPSTLMTDFERAAVSAFDETFPGLQLTGCHFHLAQNVWRHIQDHGLATVYRDEEEFAKLMRMLPALAYLPPADVENAFETVFDPTSAFWDARAQPIIDYFEDTYIGRPRRRGPRHQPMFAVQMWNLHERTLTNNAKSNNSVEGFHNAFQGLLGAHSPSLWRLIAALKKEQILVQADITRLLAGQAPAPKRRKYRDLQVRAKRIIVQYNAGQRGLIDTMEGLAFTFMF
ncbi:hypothetical protein V1264_014822 [Littorina saxatilis]|uniref:MULE transposase domain-containing protein n=1 Tax=Littorina saxatilis TaxID=31220 RepID=A0AAN9BWS6_9CAEN